MLVILFNDPILFADSALGITLLDGVFTLIIALVLILVLGMAQTMQDTGGYLFSMLLPLGLIWLLPRISPIWQSLLGFVAIAIAIVTLVLIYPWVELQQLSYGVSKSLWSYFKITTVLVPYTCVTLRVVHLNPQGLVSGFLVMLTLVLFAL